MFRKIPTFRVTSLLTLFVLVSNMFLPLVIDFRNTRAQEEVQTEAIEVENTVDTEVKEENIVVDEVIVIEEETNVEENINIEEVVIEEEKIEVETKVEEFTVVNSDIWVISQDNKTAQLNNLKLNKLYTAPQNSLLTIKFTKLPVQDGTLTVSEIKLSKSEQLALNSVTDTVYEIKSSMVNGTFAYDLTLPNPSGVEDTTVIYAQEKSGLINGEEVEGRLNRTPGIIKVSGLDHFTVFVVVNPNPVGNGNMGSSDCSVAGVDNVCYSTIQSAINAAVSGDTINIKNGTYSECLNLSGKTNISVVGESELGTVINTAACGSYGFHIHNGSGVTSDISLSNFTLTGPNTGSASNYGIKVAGVSDISMNNITVQNSRRTNIDFNGVNGAILNNITATGAVSGNGIALTDSNNFALSNITTGGNAWGGIALYAQGTFFPVGTDNFSLTGVNSIPETNGIYSQDTSGLPASQITNIDIDGYGYIAKNLSAGLVNYGYYQTDLPTAQAFANALPSPQLSYIIDTNSNLVTLPTGTISSFVGSPKYVRAGNATDVSAELHVWNQATAVRFYTNGTGPIAGTYVNVVNASTNRWRMLSPVAAGTYSVTAEIQIDGEWYAVNGNSTLYSIDIPTFNYVTPSTSGLFFRPTDRFVRIRHDDEFNQFQSVTFRIYNSIAPNGVNDQVAEYTLNRSDCDTAQAGNYVICDLVRDYSGSVTPLNDGQSYFVRIQSTVLSNSGVRYNHSNSPSQVFTVDGVAPAVNSLMITAPISPMYSDSVTLRANVTDAVSGVSQVRFFYTLPRISDGQCDPNETTIDTITSTTTVDPDTYEATFNTSALNGTYCFFATARDNAANNSNPNSATSKLSADFDNVDPTIGTVSAVTTFLGQYVRGDAAGFDIRMNATDANGIASCEYSLDGGTTWSSGVYNTVPANDRCEGLDVNALNGEVLEITMKAIDTAGNEVIGTPITRTADSMRPVVSSFAVTPSIGGFTTANPVLDFVITDDITDINRCEYRYRVTGSGGAGWSAWTTTTITIPGLSATCSANVLGLTDSTSYDFQVRGRDSVNHNSLNSSVITLTVDNTLPSTVFTSPSDGSDWNTAIDLDGISTDNVGVDYVELYYGDYDSNTWTMVTSLDNGSNNTPFNWSYDWTPASEGVYDLKAFAIDNVGNVEMTDYVMDVVYDTTAPDITFDGFKDQLSAAYNPAPMTNVCGSSNNTGFIAWEWTLNNLEVSPITYTYRIVSGPTAVGFTSTTLNTHFNGSIPMQGTYVVEVFGTDEAGNIGNTVNCEVTYDATAPITVLNAYTPNPTNDNTPTFTGAVTDTQTEITNVEYRYSSDAGTTWSSWTAANANDAFDSLSEGFNFTTAALVDGDYIFQVRGFDEAGNVEVITNDASEKTLTIDTVPPVVTVDLLETRDRRPELTGTVDDNSATIEVTVNGNTYTATNNGDGTWTLADNTISPNLADRIYDVSVTATDLASNEGFDSTTDELLVDRTAPDLSITTISFGDMLSGIFSVGGNVSDPDLTDGNDGVGVKDIFVTFMKTNGFPTITVCEATYDSLTDSYNLDVNDLMACNLVDGVYQVMVVARDNLNNTTIRIVLNIRVDNTMPVTVLNAYTPDPTNDNTPTFTGTATDNLTRISSVDYRYSSDGGTTWTPWNPATPNNIFNSNNEGFNFTTPVLADGVYIFETRATDGAGNVEIITNDASRDILTVDATVPVTVLDAYTPDPTNDNTPTFTGTATDNLTNIASVEYRYSSDAGTTWSSWAGASANDAFDSLTEGFNFTTPVLADGNYIFQSRATDQAGNTELITNDASQQMVVIDTTAPSANDLDDATFLEGGLIPTIQVMASDSYDIDRLCISLVSSPLGTASTCINDDSTVNTGYTWTLNDLLSGLTVFDTSEFDEGTYEIEYSIYDTAGNMSPVYVVTYALENVAPVVVLNSNQTINEGETATFTGSFSDPSTVDGGDGIFDDANWNAYINYGDSATDFDLGLFSDEETFTIDDHTYTNNGVYTVSLTVCEEHYDSNGIGDAECTTQTVTVTVNNLVPVVSIVASPSATVIVGNPVTLNADTSLSNQLGNSIVSYLWSGACSGSTQSVSVNTSIVGTYSCTVTVTDVDGDTAQSTINVNVNPVPVVPVTTTNTNNNIGNGNNVLGEATTPTPSPTVTPTPEDEEEGEVLGALVCDTKQQISGFVYSDLNDNDSKDNDEKGIEGVTIRIYYFDSNNDRKMALELKTDSSGKWSGEICNGNYEVEIDTDNLPDGFVLEGGKVLNVNVSDNTVQDVNFGLVEDSGFNFTSLLWCLLGVIALGALVGFIVYTMRDNKSKK